MDELSAALIEHAIVTHSGVRGGVLRMKPTALATTC